MAGMSKQLLIGRLTRDPELKTVKIGGNDVSVCNFTVAVDKEVGEGADFYTVVAWRALAENVAKFMTKGRMVFVEGRSTTRKYTVTKEGVEFENYVTETHATKVEFLDRAPQSQDAPATAVAGGQAYTAPQTTGDVPW